MEVVSLIPFVLTLYVPYTSCTTEQGLYPNLNIVSASINYSYIDPNNGAHVSHSGTLARYASDSPLTTVTGQVVHILTEDGLNHGCDSPVNVLPAGPWIALIQRGVCRFTNKILHAAVFANASAVVVYNHQEEDQLVTMQHSVNHIVSVFMGKSDGDQVASLVDSGCRLNMTISVHQVTVYEIKPSRRASPWLYISISTIVALILGLSVLMVCALRRTPAAYTTTNRTTAIFSKSNRQRQESDRERQRHLLDSGEIFVTVQ